MLRSHLLLDFDFDRGYRSELSLAEPMLDRAPADSLVIVDRGFAYPSVLEQIGKKQRHWLTRARKTTRWNVVRKLGEGDFLIESPASRHIPRPLPARAIRY